MIIEEDEEDDDINKQMDDIKGTISAEQKSTNEGQQSLSSKDILQWESQLAILEWYYQQLTDNTEISVDYGQKNGMGRYYSKTSYSLQGMCKLLRHTLTADKCHDIDMVCAHPNLLDQLCERLNQKPDDLHIKHAYLHQYIQYRKQKVEQVMEADDISYDEAKRKFLIVMYGGYVITKSPFLNGFRKRWKK